MVFQAVGLNLWRARACSLLNFKAHKPHFKCNVTGATTLSFSQATERLANGDFKYILNIRGMLDLGDPFLRKVTQH